MTARLILPALAAGAFAAAALAQSPQPGPRPPMAPPPGAPGYLAPAARPDALPVVPPAPAPGSTRDADDLTVFKATRALAGQPRWSLATSDANLAQGAGLFSCAVGVGLDPTAAPALAAVLRKATVDAYTVTDAVKNHYGRARPYTRAGEEDAPVCVPKSEGLTRNPSYPSGHASVSWTWGLILAELAPDKASAILARARSVGDSRVVCGVHYRSDIEAGRMTGAVVVAALHGDAAFRADMEHARAELGALRAGAHAAPSDCAVQDAAAEHPPY